MGISTQYLVPSTEYRGETKPGCSMLVGTSLAATGRGTAMQDRITETLGETTWKSMDCWRE